MKGYRRDGQVDARRIPVIKYVPLGRQGADGMASHVMFGADGHPQIEIDIGLKDLKRLEIELHETLHIILPGLTEDLIVRSSRYLARTLWNIGYRLNDD